MGSLRITGMATGMDTDNTIKQMMKPYQIRFDKAKQDRQIVQWQQDLYRDILSDISTFKSTYFDILKSDTYMLSKNAYAGFDVTSTNKVSGEAAGVSAIASTGAVTGTYTVEVTQLAESARLDGDSISVSNLSGEITDLSKWRNKDISFKVGNAGIEKLKLDDIAFASKEELRDNINLQIQKSTLKGKLLASVDGDKIKFNVLTDELVKLESTGVDTDLNSMVGNFINNPQKYMTTLDQLGVSATGSFDLKYMDANGASVTKTISIGDPSTTTIQGLIDKVAKETSGNIILKYSELTGKFSLETLNTGSVATIDVENKKGEDILAKLKIASTSDTGIDAKAKITPPGGNVTEISKFGNSFNIDGINYTLSKAGTTNILEIKPNTQKSYDKIKAFVDKYNELITKINKKVDEKKQYSYIPLTDEQKKDMKEDEIKRWEDKAKEGLLRNDGMLRNMLDTMRSAFFDGVEGAGITLSEIGLDTSKDTSERGKIIINEKKLKDALLSRGDQVANLFAKTSETHSTYSADLTQEERIRRGKEEGIFQRVFDVLQDYTRTSRDKDSKKGLLLEKAGIKGDLTEFKNLLTKDLEDRDKKIKDMERKLYDRENKYYQQFARLERAMNSINAQSNWLAQQLGGGSR